MPSRQTDRQADRQTERQTGRFCHRDNRRARLTATNSHNVHTKRPHEREKKSDSHHAIAGKNEWSADAQKTSASLMTTALHATPLHTHRDTHCQ